MNSTIVFAAAAVLVASVVLAIPFYLYYRRVRRKEEAFVEQHKDRVVLHVYAERSKIDGVAVESFECVKGRHGQVVVALESGTHAFEGRFRTTAVEMGKNINFVSEHLTFDVDLEAGHAYTLAVYFYSPEERSSYYDGDVGRDVFTLQLSTRGSAVYTKAYVICYEESVSGRGSGHGKSAVRSVPTAESR